MAEALIAGRSRARSQTQGRGNDLRQNLFRIPDNISIALGLRWDFIGVEPVDLDASCVAFDEDGNFMDVVFFNRLKTEPVVYMEHTGDNQTGEDETSGEDDETIILHMSKIPAKVHYLMLCVTSYTGADFTLVEQASCRLLNLATKAVVGEFQLGIVGRHSATLLCGFSRVPMEASTNGGQPPAASSTTGSNLTAPTANLGVSSQPTTWWDLREINFPCSGYTFCDVLPKMLDFLAVPEDEHQARLSRIPDYSLQKEDDSEGTLSQIRMGLGWDGENDLDAALIFLNKTGDYVDHVYAKYGRLKSRDQAAVHSGDKLNGYEVIGDDEFVDLDLNKVDKDVEFIFFISLLYDGFAKNLGSVPHAYCRITNKTSPHDKKTNELNRYVLKHAGGNTCAIISYTKRISAAHWEHKKLNEGTGGRDYVDIFPIVRSIARCHPNFEEWQTNRLRAQDQFAIEVTVVEARDLSPLEPHQFACHVRVWVCDRKGKGRVKSSICHDRDNIKWGGSLSRGGAFADPNQGVSDGSNGANGNGGDGESFSFAVNRMDVVRVLLYEHSLVGVVDLAVSQIASDLFGEVNMGQVKEEMLRQDTTMPPTGNQTEGEEDVEGDTAAEDEGQAEKQVKQQPENNHKHGAGERKKSNANEPPAQPELLPAIAKNSDRILDQWYPLVGRGISGEIRLQIKQVPMSQVPDENAGEGTSGGGGGWCSVM